MPWKFPAEALNAERDVQHCVKNVGSGSFHTNRKFVSNLYQDVLRLLKTEAIGKVSLRPCILVTMLGVEEGLHSLGKCSQSFAQLLRF